MFARCGLRAKSVHLCSRRKTLGMLDFTKDLPRCARCFKTSEVARLLSNTRISTVLPGSGSKENEWLCCHTLVAHMHTLSSGLGWTLYLHYIEKQGTAAQCGSFPHTGLGTRGTWFTMTIPGCHSEHWHSSFLNGVLCIK